MTTIVMDSEERRAYALKVIAALPIEPAQDIEISRHIDRRTNAQNRRLWLLHAAAGKEVGMSEGEMHEEMLCLKYGFVFVKTPWGERKTPLKRSSTRDKKEFAEFMTFVEETYIKELGVFLP